MKYIILICIGILLIPSITAFKYQTEINISIKGNDVTVRVGKDTFGPYPCDENRSRVYDLIFDDIMINDDSFDVYNLTKTLIEVNKRTLQGCSTNITGECTECIEGRAIVATLRDRYKEDWLTCRNKTDNLENNLTKQLTSAQVNSTRFYSDLSNCESNLGKRNSEVNEIKNENETLKKKPTTWGIIGVIIGIAGTVMFHRGKYPVSSEEKQFGGGAI